MLQTIFWVVIGVALLYAFRRPIGQLISDVAQNVYGRIIAILGAIVLLGVLGYVFSLVSGH